MSTPENPLDKYRSYSFHHILIVANTTEALANYCNPQGSNAANFLGDVLNKNLGEELSKDVYLVVDTRKTSEFSISNLNIITTVGGSDSPSATTMLASKVIMNLVDPSGIGFYNYLKYLIDIKLKTDPAGLKFLLYTTFIGHTHSGTTETVDGIFIPLILGSVFSLTSFTTKGGEYEIEFFAASGTMSSNNTPYTLIPGTANYQAKESLLGNAVQSFENYLNITSKNFYKTYNPIDASAPSKTGQSTNNAQNSGPKKGRLVQYMITIPENWFKFKLPTNAENVKETIFTSSAKTNTTQNTDQAGGKQPTSYHSSMSNDTINSALNDLLLLSPEVNALASLTKKQEGTAKIFKILTSVTSDSETVVVHFDVVEYDIKNVNQPKPQVAESTPNATTNFPKFTDTNPRGSIAFDFIFSGKNTDIINLDLKIDNLQLPLTSKPMIAISAKEQIVGTALSKKNDTPIEKSTTETIMVCNEFQPIIHPARSGAESEAFVEWSNRNSKDYNQTINDRQEFHKALSDQQMTSIEPHVKIRGNPDLLRGFTVSTIPPHKRISSSVQEFIGYNDAKIEQLSSWEYDTANTGPAKAAAGSTIASAHVEHRQYIDKLIGNDESDVKSTSRFLAVGQYAKINVFGPRDYPFSREAGLGKEYRVQLFYDGWYQIFEITHSFEGANFTQELVLKSIDSYGVPLTTQTITNPYATQS